MKKLHQRSKKRKNWSKSRRNRLTAVLKTILMRFRKKIMKIIKIKTIQSLFRHDEVWSDLMSELEVMKLTMKVRTEKKMVKLIV